MAGAAAAAVDAVAASVAVFAIRPSSTIYVCVHQNITWSSVIQIENYKIEFHAEDSKALKQQQQQHQHQHESHFDQSMVTSMHTLGSVKSAFLSL